MTLAFFAIVALLSQFMPLASCLPPMFHASLSDQNHDTLTFNIIPETNSGTLERGPRIAEPLVMSQFTLVEIPFAETTQNHHQHAQSKQFLITEHLVFEKLSHAESPPFCHHLVHDWMMMYRNPEAQSAHFPDIPSPQCFRQLSPEQYHRFLEILLPLPQYAHLNSTTGTQRLARTLSRFAFQKESEQVHLLLPLLMQFETQYTQTWCSIASLANVLNAISANVAMPMAHEYEPYAYATQRALYDNANMPESAKCVSKVLPLDQLTLRGSTLEQLFEMMRCYVPLAHMDSKFQVDDHNKVQLHLRNNTQVRFSAEMHFASDWKPDTWKNHAAQHLSNGSLIIINFSRVHLSEMGGGHFSVLTMWDEISETALLSDTARYKYPMAFVPAEDLYEAMNSVDLTSQKSRGWITLSRVVEKTHAEERCE